MLGEEEEEAFTRAAGARFARGVRGVSGLCVR